MPRRVDHAQRRAELLAATWRVVRERGVEGTTTRAIADEAGCSLSVLAHFLGGKDAILTAAQTAVYERIVERAFALGGELSGLAALRAALQAALPLDEERTADAQVNVAFAGAALSSPRLAQARRSAHERIRALLRTCLAEAHAGGELRSGVTDDEVLDDFIVLVEGATLLTLVDGRHENDQHENDQHENDRHEDDRHEDGRAARLQRMAGAFVERLRAP